MPYADPTAKADWARRYHTEHRDEVNDNKRRWAARNPEKRQAQWAVGNALRDGRLERGSCLEQGPDCSCRVEAHHDDYALPLDVTWLCTYHHGLTRRKDLNAV